MEGYRSLQLRNDYPFDLNHTLNCGQTSRWERIGDWWYGIVGDTVIKTRQVGDVLYFSGCSEKFYKDYFSWDYDLLNFYGAFPGDPHLELAIRENRGLRIIHQDPWECVCFQLLVNKVRLIPKVDSFTRISQKMGDRIELDGHTFYTFPDAETILEGGLSQLKSCNLGYKADNIFLVAKKVVDNLSWVHTVENMDLKDANQFLSELKGIRPLVAEWILLFAFERTELFPVDSHIRDIMCRTYLSRMHFPKSDCEKIDRVIGDYANEHFGKYSGYVFEYLFASRDAL
ncbi:DNA-3-methyladenine glycosylase family protein [Methanogenium cariaci]|jgi:N-glycosylase/DNA lyase